MNLLPVLRPVPAFAARALPWVLALAVGLGLAAGCENKQAPDGTEHAAGAGPLTLESYTADDAGGAASSVLIQGTRAAILVDAQLTRDAAEQVVKRIHDSGRTLRSVFITDSRPDRYFGLSVIREAFPGVAMQATPAVVATMQKTAVALHGELRKRLGEAIPNAWVLPEPYEGKTLELEGHTIRIQPLGPGESPASAVLYIPDAKALIAGDLVTNGVHPWLADGRYNGWLRELHAVAKLGPIETVYPGHGAPGGPKLLRETEGYIRIFAMVTDRSHDAAEAVREMQTLTPFRVAENLERAVAARFARGTARPTD